MTVSFDSVCKTQFSSAPDGKRRPLRREHFLEEEKVYPNFPGISKENRILFILLSPRALRPIHRTQDRHGQGRHPRSRQRRDRHRGNRPSHANWRGVWSQHGPRRTVISKAARRLASALNGHRQEPRPGPPAPRQRQGTNPSHPGFRSWSRRPASRGEIGSAQGRISFCEEAESR